jgi:hypothetical protein
METTIQTRWRMEIRIIRTKWLPQPQLLPQQQQQQ